MVLLEGGEIMVKPKKFFCAFSIMLMLSMLPVPTVLTPVSRPMTCMAMTYDEFKSKVTKITDGAKKFWQDSAGDRAKLAKKAQKKWQKLQKKIKKEYKKARKKGKKGMEKFKKWRKKQEKEFWQWYNGQLS